MNNTNLIIGVGSGIGKELIMHLLRKGEYVIGISSK